ncbi:MAG TPA: hypothetical protein VKX45_22710 [Bryobacteraceae bacterium]|jgi:chromosome segregation ATPase|nr:hypothetical protein [Bryobacteraceae bacterium]
MDDSKATLTHQDLAALRQDLTHTIESLTAGLADLERRLDASITGVAEKVLESVFRLAEALQSRVSDLERSDANLKHRLAMLEERLTVLEKKLNLPPVRVQ